MKRLILAAAGALVLSACATPTAYAPHGYAGQSGGYSEQRLQSDRWSVAFAGNSLTSRETVEIYLLYRAAELTVQSGYDWFITDYRTTDEDTRYYATPDPWGSRFNPYWDRYGAFWGPRWRFYRGGYWSGWDRWGRNMDVQQVTRYEAHAEIIMGRGAMPPAESHGFNAREVLENLGPRVVRPDPGV